MNNTNKEKFFFFYDESCEPIIFPGSLSHGYLAILNNDLNSALAVFGKSDSSRGRWGVSLVSILKGYLTEFPTYFGIRNFLEIDLDFLLKNNKIDYVEQCLGALEFLSSINQETFKFTARVMLQNKLYTSALKYMERSKEIFYNDPELHFMYAKYYMDINNYKDAYICINECLHLLPEYYPAQILKQRIEQIGF